MDTLANIKWFIPFLFIPALMLIMAIIFYFKQLFPIMKNLFTFLVVIYGTLNSLQAQPMTTPKEKRFGLGVFAGLNYSFPLIINQFADHFKPHANLLTGIDLRYRLSDNASLHLQPSWTQVNDVRPKSSWAIPIFSFNTIRVPVIYRYYVLPSRKLLFLQTGVSYNYLATSNFRQEQIVVCITAPCPRFIGPDIAPTNKSALSGIAGIGINIALQKISIPVTLQYERYMNSYLFPGQFEAKQTSVKFEGFALTTGVNF